MLQLADAPAAVVYAQPRAELSASAVTAAAQLQIATIQAAQATLTRQLATFDTPVLFATQRVYNGVAVLATAGQLETLRNLPGVAAVHPIVAKQPDNATSVPYIGVPILWDGANALAVHGEGIRVAVIDTGIDYLHADFGGPGAGYAENDTTKIGDSPFFPGPRVFGGYDFVGDAYNADPSAFDYQPVARPDADPMDCYGHGTHVAGTLGGSGIDATGATYAGPYTSAAPFSTMIIGPGVAPRAQLYALKIFGCTGSTDFTDAALEWSVDPNGDGDFSDHMDVVNLSLGSPFGAAYDTSAIAADNAAAAGVIVVASAGNSGNTYLIASTPSVSDRAISVAATQHHAPFNWGAGSSTVAGTDTLAGFSARGPRRGDLALKPDLAAPGTAIISAAVRTGTGSSTLSGTSMAAPHVAGVMALLRQLHPDWSVEELKALAMNTSMPVVRVSDPITAALYSPTLIGAGRIAGAPAGQAQAVAYAEGGSGRVGLSFGAPEVLPGVASLQVDQTVEIANKSAVPLTYLASYYPISDLPGTAFQLPGQPVTVAPHGISQLPITLQIEPKNLRHVRASIADQVTGAAGQWLDEASGQLYLWPVKEPTGTAFEAQLSLLETSATAISGRATFLYSPTAHAMSYTLHLEGVTTPELITATVGIGRAGETGATLYVLHAKLASAALAASGTFTLPAPTEPWLASGLLYVQVELGTHPGQQWRGQLMPTAPVLHLPVYASPKPVSIMASTPGQLTFAPPATAPQDLHLAGQGIIGSAVTTGVTSLASIYELQLQSAPRPGSTGAGLDTPHTAPADLKYVGLRTYWAPDSPRTIENAWLLFGLASYAPWSTPNEVSFLVWIDVDNDGLNDYLLINTDRPYFASNTHSDNFASVLIDLHASSQRVEAPLNGLPNAIQVSPYLSSVMVLPVRAASLGLDATHTQFHYFVQTSSIDSPDEQDKTVERTPRLAYNLAGPVLGFSGGVDDGIYFLDRSGTTLQVQPASSSVAGLFANGILVFHHANRPTQQAAVIKTSYVWPQNIYLPAAAR